MIKLYSIISLLPALLIFQKMRKRQDLTCIDILVLFQTLYMCIVPIIGDTEKVLNIVRDDGEVQFMIFFYYNIFIWFLVIADRMITANINLRGTPYHFTVYIRKWIENNKLKTSTIFFLLLLSLLQWYIAQMDFDRLLEFGGNISQEQERELQADYNTPFNMFLSGGILVVRLYVMMVAYAFYYQWKKGTIKMKSNWPFILLIISEVFIHLQIPRIQFLETLFFLLFVFYSVNKSSLTMKNLSRYAVIMALAVVVVLPIMSGVKIVRRLLTTGNVSYSNFIEVMETGIGMMLKGDVDIESADNKSERMWDLYQSVGIGVKADYQGDGTLTLYAILHSIPKAIYPDKPADGSQSLVEKHSGMNHDISDSLLLIGIMENKVIGPLLGILYYFIVFFSLVIVASFLRKVIPEQMCNPVTVAAFFNWMNHIEISFDGWVSSVIAFVLWYLFFFFMIKSFSFFNIRFIKHKYHVTPAIPLRQN